MLEVDCIGRTHFHFPLYSTRLSLIPYDKKRFLFSSERLMLHDKFIGKLMSNDKFARKLFAIEALTKFQECKDNNKYLCLSSYDYALLCMWRMEDV